jgi:hypothetical protein
VETHFKSGLGGEWKPMHVSATENGKQKFEQTYKFLKYIIKGAGA